VQPHHQIGAHPLVLGLAGDLLGEVTVLEQPGRLDDPAQLMLAPATADLRCPERGEQLFGVGPQLAGDRAHRPHLLAQLGVGVHPVVLQLADPLLVAPQRVVQRRDRPGHRLLRLRGRLEGQRPHRLLEPRLAVPPGLQRRLEPGDVGGRPHPGGEPAEGSTHRQADDHHGQRREGHVLHFARGV
jgi:hypothetical protein